MSCKTSAGSGPLSLFDIGWQHGPGYASCWYCVRICLAPVSHFVTPPPPPQNAWHVNWWICDENIQTLDLEVECPLQCPANMKRAHRLDLGQDVSGCLILESGDFSAKMTPAATRISLKDSWQRHVSLSFQAARREICVIFIVEKVKPDSNDNILFLPGVTTWLHA